MSLPPAVWFVKDLVAKTPTIIYGPSEMRGERKLSAITPEPVIVLIGGGYFGKFAVEDSKEYGTTSLSVPIVNAEELAALQGLDRHTSGVFKERFVSEAYNPILRPGNLKDKLKPDGERYPASLKFTVDKKPIRIVDDKGAAVPLRSLPGRKWKRIVFECPSIYYSGEKFGLSKNLLMVVVEAERISAEVLDQLQFLNELPPDPQEAPKEPKKKRRLPKETA